MSAGKLYSEESRETVVCSLGCEHVVVFNHEATVEPTGVTEKHEYIKDSGIWLVDQQLSTPGGFIIWSRATVDNPTYVDESGRHWRSRPADDYGRAIAANLVGERYV